MDEGRVFSRLGDFIEEPPKKSKLKDDHDSRQ
jgi:hypothetical protein